MDEIGKDEVANIFKKLVDDGDEDLIDAIKEIIKEKPKLSSRKMSNILGFSNSTFVILEIQKKNQLISESHIKKSLRIWSMTS